MDDHTYDGNTEDNLGAEPTFSNGNDAVCILDIENPYHNIHGEFDHVEDWSSPREDQSSDHDDKHTTTNYFASVLWRNMCDDLLKGKADIVIFFEFDDHEKLVVTSIQDFEQDCSDPLSHGTIQRHPESQVHQMVLRQVPKFFTKHETINYLFSKVEQIVADSDNQNEVESTILDFFHERFTDQSKCASLWQRDTPYKLLYPLLKNLSVSSHTQMATISPSIRWYM